MTEVATVDPDVLEGTVLRIAEPDELVIPVCGGLDAEDGEAKEEYTERPMIPVELLTAHPGNVREDKQADQGFLRSVGAVGVLVPLEITVAPGGGYRVVDGNIRLDAAVRTGKHAVPYFFSADTADDEGLQYLHMLITSRFRKSLSVHEEAAALFEASKLMTRADIRKATGLSAAEVKAGVRAGGLSDHTKELAAGMEYEWTLEELALLRPFEDDPEAMQVITRSQYNPIKYTVQRLLDEREARARRAKMLAELEQAGVTVTDDRPDGALFLHRLLNGEQVMDAEAHAGCPGRGATVGAWREAQPSFYCLDPVKYGHVFVDTGTTSPPKPLAVAAPGGRDAKPSANRKIVVEGNKAWEAAGTVRQQWLVDFLARSTPPKNVAAVIARFVTEQLVTMPEPLCRALGSARHSRMFQSFGNPSSDTVAKSTQPGLWMIALAPIATAFEREITGDGERRNTWRQDKYSPCTRQDVGAWLRFLAEIGAKHGYEPSPIEKAVAEGTPYLGDNPAQDALGADDLDRAEDTDSEEREGELEDDLEGKDHDDHTIDPITHTDEQASRGSASTEPVTETDLADPALPQDPDDTPHPAQEHLAAEVAQEMPEADLQAEAA